MLVSWSIGRNVIDVFSVDAFPLVKSCMNPDQFGVGFEAD